MESASLTMDHPKWSRRNRLWLKSYLAVPLFADDVFGELETIVRRSLPNWGSQLRAGRNPDVPTSAVEPGNLGKIVSSIAPARRGLGSAVLKGAYKGLTIYLDSWEGTVPPELNVLSVEVTGLLSIDGQSPPEWAAAFLETLAGALPIRYGNARLEDEFTAKNMVDDATGLRAIGVKLTESLPGLYWLNYFGLPYLQLIGEGVLSSAPAHRVQKVGAGILLVLDETPLAWMTAPYREREQVVLQHLGQRFFFSRDDPGRVLAAPRFERST